MVARKAATRIVLGGAAFLLPAVMAAIGLRLDRSSLARDTTFAALIPAVMWGSVVVAAAVPAALILTSGMSLPRRLGLIAATWCMLALECGAAVYIVLMEGLR